MSTQPDQPEESQNEFPFASRDEYVRELESVIVAVNRQNIHLRATLDEICERTDLMAQTLSNALNFPMPDDKRDTIHRMLKDWQSVRM